MKASENNVRHNIPPHRLNLFRIVNDVEGAVDTPKNEHIVTVYVHVPILVEQRTPAIMALMAHGGPAHALHSTMAEFLNIFTESFFSF